MNQLDIVVVGAGLSGLAASIQCALSGHGVTVLESAKELAEVCVPFEWDRFVPSFLMSDSDNARLALASN
jgi:flavin-dependent dehydrogenase